MSLDALMPPEKREAVIYVMPSVAIALWISSVFLVSKDLTEWLALTGLLASALTLFFSMVNLDVYITRRLLREDVREKQESQLEEAIPVFNILLQNWQISSEPSTGKDWISRWKKNIIADAVASYPVRNRSWYWRLSTYSSIAIVFLLLTPLVSNSLGLQQTSYISIQPGNASILQWILGIAVLAGLTLPWVANYWRDYRGAKNFTRDTRFVAEFQYLQYLVGLDYIKRPEYYAEGSSLSSLEQELERLQMFLYRGDWSIFVRSWGYLRQGLIDDVNERINSLYYPDLFILWTDIVTEQPSKIHSRRRLELLLRVASHKPPTGIAEEAITFISANGELRDPSTVNIVEFFTEERKQEHKEIRNIVRSYYPTAEFPNYMNDRLMLLNNRLNSLGVRIK
ncbi:MAG: hypothetical protein ACE5IO_08845 [Thermoplasmata archaeon]